MSGNGLFANAFEVHWCAQLETRHQLRASQRSRLSFWTGTPEMTEANKLREFASWYREFAARSGNPRISVPRLQMATELDREAEKLDDALKQDHR